MSLEFIDKAEVLLSLEKLKLFYSFQNELLSFYLSIFFIKTAFQSINNSIVSAQSYLKKQTSLKLLLKRANFMFLKTIF